jgi:Domain of unknown function (DUF5666)
MNRQCVKLSWLCAQFALLGGCARGGSGVEGLQGGIEGSGHQITASGAVTALGSIFVNGVEYDVNGATVTTNGAPALESDLAPGQITIVEGQLSADGKHGTARRVTVEIAVAGPISVTDVQLSRLSILGQTIAIDSKTVIDGSVDGTPLGGLGVGQDVEVSGFADSSGVLHARRIESRRSNIPLLITGRIANVDISAQTFSINGQVVSYAAATLSGLEAPVDGTPVRVTATSTDGGALVAGEISVRDPHLPGVLDDTAVVQGWVTRFDSESDFDVDGHPVITTADTTIDGVTRPGGVVRLDAFVTVSGKLIANNVVQAGDITALLPGSLSGDVTIDGSTLGVEGVLTAEGAFRLNIAEWSGGPVSDSGLGLLVGDLIVRGSEASGTGVLIGEGCGLSPPGRFCGAGAAVNIELTKTGSLIDEGASGVITVTTNTGQESWPLRLGYWGGRPGFDPPLNFAGLYEIHQAEFAQGDPVVTMNVGSRLFFQSAQTGCTGNGTMSSHPGASVDLYDVKLTIEGCNNSFSYLNTSFEGLSTLESLTPWDYDFSTLRMWLSTPADAASPAAITLWGIAN